MRAKTTSIMEYSGLWINISDKEAGDMKKNIENFSRKFTKELLRRTNKN